MSKDSFGSFFSRIISDSSVGNSHEDLYVLVSLVEMYYQQTKTSDLKVLNLLPCLTDSNNKNSIGTSLGCAIQYLNGSYKISDNEGWDYKKYNPDIFFSVAGLHFMLTQLWADSRSLFPELASKAEKIATLILTNSRAMNGINLCLSNLQKSSVGYIDIMCPILSVISEARGRPIAETHRAYTTIFKSGVQPAFRLRKFN